MCLRCPILGLSPGDNSQSKSKILRYGSLAHYQVPENLLKDRTRIRK
jgi:hypothetical protein